VKCLLALAIAVLALAACEGLPGAGPAATPTPRPPYADQSEAIATAEAAGDPKARALAYYERANAKFDAAEYQGAIADYDRAVALDAGLARAYNNRALAYQALGKDEQALADFGAAIGADTSYIRAYKNRIALLERTDGDLRLRADDYAALAQLEPGQAAAYQYQRGLALRRAGDPSGAAAAYDAALAANPEFVDAYYERGLLRAAAGERSAALADLDRAAGLSPRAANVFYSRGLLRSLAGNMAGAIGDFTRALDLRSGDYPEARIARAEALLDAGDQARARADIDQLDIDGLEEPLHSAAQKLQARLVSP
jgi:tetratricopeptide (TPR) repeat protein